MFVCKTLFYSIVSRTLAAHVLGMVGGTSIKFGISVYQAEIVQFIEGTMGIRMHEIIPSFLMHQYCTCSDKEYCACVLYKYLPYSLNDIPLSCALELTCLRAVISVATWTFNGKRL